MVAFAFPNADNIATNNEMIFIGACVLETAPIAEKEPGTEFKPYTINIEAINNAVSSLIFHNRIDQKHTTWEVYVRDNLSDEYRGESMDLAYFLAKFMTKEPLADHLLEHRDIWATGALKEIRDTSGQAVWYISAVNPEGLKAKIRGFLLDMGDEKTSRKPSNLFILPLESYNVIRNSLDDIVAGASKEIKKEINMKPFTMAQCSAELEINNHAIDQEMITKNILAINSTPQDLMALINYLFPSQALATVEASHTNSTDPSTTDTETVGTLKGDDDPETSTLDERDKEGIELTGGIFFFIQRYFHLLVFAGLFLSFVFVLWRDIHPVGWVSPASIGNLSATLNHGALMEGLADGYWKNDIFFPGKSTVLEEDGIKNGRPGDFYFGVVLHGENRRKISRIRFLSDKQMDMLNHIKSFDIQIQQYPDSKWITVRDSLEGYADRWNEAEVFYPKAIHGIRISYTKISYGAPTVLDFQVFIDEIPAWSIVLKLVVIAMIAAVLLKIKKNKFLKK